MHVRTTLIKTDYWYQIILELWHICPDFLTMETIVTLTSLLEVCLVHAVHSAHLWNTHNSGMIQLTVHSYIHMYRQLSNFNCTWLLIFLLFRIFLIPVSSCRITNVVTSEVLKGKLHVHHCSGPVKWAKMLLSYLQTYESMQLFMPIYTGCSQK